MSIRDLPREVLDLVFSQIHDKTSAPTFESQTAFSSLCLTSKSFLPLAREHLYYRPFRSRESNRSLEKSLGLLSVLQQLQPPLSLLVGSLEDVITIFVGLNFGYHDVNDPKRSPFPLISKYRDSYEYLHRLLEICSNLRTLALALHKPEQLAKVTQSLQISAATIKTLLLKNSEQSLVHEVLAHPLFRHVEALTVSDIDPPFRNLVVELPPIQLPLKTKTLRSEGYQLSVGCLRQLIPVESLSFVEFSLSFNRNTDSTLDLIPILDLLPTTLRRLSITCVSYDMRDRHRPMLEDYSRDRRNPVIQLDSLSRFSSLQTLVLQQFEGPLLALLQTLIKSSPSLQSIDFLFSRWIPHDPTALLTPESMFPSTEIYDTLCTFPSLHYIHFGYLPTSRREDYEDLLDKLRERGIRADWTECRPKKVELSWGYDGSGDLRGKRRN